MKEVIVRGIFSKHWWERLSPTKPHKVNSIKAVWNTDRNQNPEFVMCIVQIRTKFDAINKYLQSNKIKPQVHITLEPKTSPYIPDIALDLFSSPTQDNLQHDFVNQTHFKGYKITYPNWAMYIRPSTYGDHFCDYTYRKNNDDIYASTFENADDLINFLKREFEHIPDVQSLIRSESTIYDVQNTVDP